jgi:DNA-directed RNA polymerase specialized sigma24 family protein
LRAKSDPSSSRAARAQPASTARDALAQERLTRTPASFYAWLTRIYRRITLEASRRPLRRSLSRPGEAAEAGKEKAASGFERVKEKLPGR